MEVGMRMRNIWAFYLTTAVGVVVFGLCSVDSSLAGRTEYLCGDGDYHYNCNGYSGWKCQDNKVKNNPADCKNYGGTVKRVIPVCGDGIVDVLEQCDNGADNSDLEPNACRSNCRSAYCGDSVVDAGEECDEGSGSQRPNHCRPDCTLPFCGDGILDDGSYGPVAFLEECDDGNSNDLDGCRSDCKSCLRLESNIEVTADTRLCGDVYQVPDYGDEGVIIVKFPGVTVDCGGATIRGAGTGTGIFVKMSNGVKIKNCNISGFEAGVKAANSQGLLIASGNDFAQNARAVVLENSTRVYEDLMPEVPGNLQSAAEAGTLNQEGTKAGMQEEKIQGRGSIFNRKPVQEPPATSGVSTGEDKAADSLPVIIYPRSGQNFSAPASFVAKVEGENPGRLVYKLKNLHSNKLEQHSYDGRFNNIPAGEYCIEAAFMKNPGASGDCISFMVIGPPQQQEPVSVPPRQRLLKPMKTRTLNIR